MFIAWLHSECGYTFIGETSFYRLTYGEMAHLHAGFEIMNEQSEMQEKGVSPHTQTEFRKFASKVNSGGAT